MQSDSRVSRRKLLQLAAATTAVSCLRSPSARAEPESNEPRLRVMSFNILKGGEQLESLEQTAKVIQAAKPDLVGLQEVKKSGEKLAKMCDMHWHDQGDEDVCILSRFPIVGHDPKHWGVRLELPGGKHVWHINCHLAHAPYQPYQLARIPYGENNPFIDTAAEAIAEALRARAAQVARMLMVVGGIQRSGEPVFITGDFNEPSHLDWTAHAVEKEWHPLAVAWPTSRAIVDAGLADSYRTVYPNEVEQPGLTWSPRPQKQDVMDRIDLIYHTPGKATCRSAQVVGENDQHADIVVAPFPSDHRAVVCEYTLG